MSDDTATCASCWVMKIQCGELHACPKHATPEQRKLADDLIAKLADEPHPLLEFIRKSKP